MENRHYYRNADKTAYWNVRKELTLDGIIEITEEEYNEHLEEEDSKCH